MKTHTIELSNYLSAQVEDRAQCTGRTVSYLIARALEEVLGIKQVPVTRRARNGGKR
jgi:predicted transcriptional regulator